MPALVVPNALQVVVSGSNLGQTWTNVYGIAVEGTLLMAQSTADAIAAEFVELYEDWASSFNDQWQANQCVVNDLRSATAPSYDAAWTNVLGVAGLDPLPPNFAICISHSTGRRGKSYRGRSFWGGWAEDALDGNGLLTSNFDAALVTSFNNLRARLQAIPDTDLTLGVISRTLLEVNPVTAHSVDRHFDHQDRRKRV